MQAACAGGSPGAKFSKPVPGDPTQGTHALVRRIGPDGRLGDATRVTSDALQILGGAGYTKLHAVERYWRDARLTKIFEGTSEIMLRLVSDSLLPPTPLR